MTNFKNLKVIIFDFDGTLVDLNVDWKRLKQELKTRFNFKLPIYTGLSNLSPNSRIKALELMSKYELENKNSYQYHELPIKFIKTNKKFKIALVSNNTKKTIHIILSELKLTECFSSIISLDDITYGKPYPEGLELTLKNLKTKNQESCFLGDKESDKIAGIKAGIFTIIDVKQRIEFLNSLSS